MSKRCVLVSCAVLMCFGCGGGEAGPTGPAGPAGPAGPEGAAGMDGAQGPAGMDGAAGMDGMDGMAGMNGMDGMDGERGAIGAPGYDAFSVIPVAVPTSFELSGYFFPWDLEITNDGRFFTGSIIDGQIVQWSLESPRPITFAAAGTETGRAFALTLSPDEETLWTCYVDLPDASSNTILATTIVGFDVASGQVVARHQAFPNNDSVCSDLDFDANGNLYATGYRIGDMGPEGEISRVPSDRLMMDNSAATWFTPPMGTQLFLTVSFDEDLLLIVGDSGEVSTIAINPDGSPGAVSVLIDAADFPGNTFSSLHRAKGGVHYGATVDGDAALFRIDVNNAFEPLSIVATDAGVIEPLALNFHAGRAWVAELQLTAFNDHATTGMSDARTPFRIVSVPALEGDLPLSPVELQGAWHHGCAERDGENTTGSVTFSTQWWRRVITYYEDASCSTPSHEVMVEGPYDTGHLVGTHTAIDLHHATVSVRALSQAGVEALTQASCGEGIWEVGSSEKLADGCGTIAPAISSCPTSHTVVNTRPGELGLGAWGAATCDESARATMVRAEPWTRR